MKKNIEENEFNENIRRIVITSPFGTDQANGIVVDSDTRAVLCVPPKRLLTNAQIGPINEYDIYEAKDGTIINLYFWHGKWNISSARCHELNNLCWIGEKTYEEIFTSFIAKYDIDLSKLDRSSSHTVGIKFRDLHWFQSDKEEMWYVSSFSLTQKKFIVDEYLSGKLPIQQQIKIQLKKMQNNTRTAIRYFQMTGLTTFGYILRHKGDGSDIYLESSLMRKIRQTIYLQSSILVNNKNRRDFILWRAYLFRDPIIFNLFPEFIEEFKKNDKVIDELVDKCFIMIKIPHDNSNQTEKIDKLANILYNTVIKAERPGGPTNDLKSLIRDIIISPKNLEIYFTVLCCD
ncbi:MAG: hypothetical protein KAS12_01600 [Candidatus Aenigmarchaeota archaeon]|nr:hypothetical protein [Candidatus Aenigmarchaeota archaeon]